MTPNDTVSLRGGRFSVPLASLVDGATYRWVVEVANDGASAVTASMNWNDVNAATQTFVVQPGERRIIGINAARATYDSTFRFGDLRVASTTQQSLLFRTPTIERTDLPTNPFDGSYPTSGELSYSWVAAADASDSIEWLTTTTITASLEGQVRSAWW